MTMTLGSPASRARLLASLLIVAAAGAACGAEADPAIEMIGSDFVPPEGELDVHLLADDFTCLQDWTQVRRFRVRNFLGLQEQAVAVAESGIGPYPVGTVIMGFPDEAMVKRGRGFSPDTQDWEFLYLSNSEEGTIIRDRGTTEVRGMVGNCLECHSKAAPEYDLVCQDGRGCDDQPLLGPAFQVLTDADPRCGSGFSQTH